LQASYHLCVPLPLLLLLLLLLPLPLLFRCCTKTYASRCRPQCLSPFS
jgi:hypothetical protein